MPCFTINERLRRLLAKRQKELDRKAAEARPPSKPKPAPSLHDPRIRIGARVRKNAAFPKSKNDAGTVIKEYGDICFVRWDSDRDDSKGMPFYKKYLELTDEP
ncbi:hypothetical protein DFP91_0212 [Pseudorhodoplanes sinuspersici]|uniref:Uncharacterized protein n=1 Tax=Pseudorhodoplanes sinuspersici TaxID=1235591 RepID=A0A1W6ZTK9_9HYPH|nr:hypothetical protein CAK95_17840 [Pseudorhodoplanes sinuspersici]RKE72348.1 hypothetical protein DFP91_0212 [Pseudorhodoplanes sinuspersici]